MQKSRGPKLMEINLLYNCGVYVPCIHTSPTDTNLAPTNRVEYIVYKTIHNDFTNNSISVG
jgi:hypothetical protein